MSEKMQIVIEKRHRNATRESVSQLDPGLVVRITPTIRNYFTVALGPAFPVPSSHSFLSSCCGDIARLSMTNLTEMMYKVKGNHAG